jgi:hypothetical protein
VKIGRERDADVDDWGRLNLATEGFPSAAGGKDFAQIRLMGVVKFYTRKMDIPDTGAVTHYTSSGHVSNLGIVIDAPEKLGGNVPVQVSVDPSWWMRFSFPEPGSYFISQVAMTHVSAAWAESQEFQLGSDVEELNIMPTAVAPGMPEDVTCNNSNVAGFEAHLRCAIKASKVAKGATLPYVRVRVPLITTGVVNPLRVSMFISKMPDDLLASQEKARLVAPQPSFDEMFMKAMRRVIAKGETPSTLTTIVTSTVWPDGKMVQDQTIDPTARKPSTKLTADCKPAVDEGEALESGQVTPCGQPALDLTTLDRSSLPSAPQGATSDTMVESVLKLLSMVKGNPSRDPDYDRFDSVLENDKGSSSSIKRLKPAGRRMSK